MGKALGFAVEVAGKTLLRRLVLLRHVGSPQRICIITRMEEGCSMSHANLNKAQTTLVQRLQDSRSKKVVFLSHCILNENTRYLGGACRRGCIREIVEQCLEYDLGIVQMPCPEQYAWGGVLKRLLLLAYGLKWRFPLAYRLRGVLIPVGLLYTRLVYRRLAQQTVRQIEDYLASGFSVVGIVGIDGSPTCAVNKALDFHGFDLIATIPLESITVDKQNTILRECVMDGKGIFIDELHKELKRRRINIPYQAHDLIAELDGKKSTVEFGEFVRA